METGMVEGGCTCRHVRYRLEAAPIIVHCCHCSWCQRETGSAFVVNALMEADQVTLLQGEVVLVHTPSASGKGQRIARCPRCHVALWSHYPGGGDAIRFVRVGRWTRQVASLRISTSTPRRGCRGYGCRKARAPSTGSTIHARNGRRKRSRAIARPSSVSTRAERRRPSFTQARATSSPAHGARGMLRPCRPCPSR